VAAALEEKAALGLDEEEVYLEDDEGLEGQACGPLIPEVAETHMGVTPGKVVGRAKRRAQEAAGQGQGERHMAAVHRPVNYEVPVELAVPPARVSGGRSPNMHPGHLADRQPPRSPHYGDSPQRSPHQGDHPPNYEGLKFQQGTEHAYSNVHTKSPRSPTAHPQIDAPYEEMSVSGKYGQQISPGWPPTGGTRAMSHSPGGPHSGPRTPSQPDRYVQAPVTPRSPVSPQSDNRYNTEPVRNDDKYNTPVRSDDRYNTNYVPSDDRYNSEPTNRTRPSHSTYLTDDNNDDGGFSGHVRSPRLASPGYDLNSNKQNKYDSYNDSRSPGYSDPRDRYAGNGQYQGQGGTVEVTGPRGQPVPAPRGFHRQQGSGRSDTSASDSGFGENDSIETSRHKVLKKGVRGGDSNTDMTKGPYYNRAFELESPERDEEIESILAKHKVLAGQAHHSQAVPNGGVPRGQDRYNDDPQYTRELQRWRRNINDLEESCSGQEPPRVAIQSGAEPMEESFI